MIKFAFFASNLKSNTEAVSTCGRLLISGGTNWDMIGRKEVAKSGGGWI